MRVDDDRTFTGRVNVGLDLNGKAHDNLNQRLEGTMAHSVFRYETYIRTTPEKLWSALTDAERIRQYWFGVRCESGWTPGASWRMVYPDGRTTDTGEILEAEPYLRLVIRWWHQDRAELKAEGESRCTMELEPGGSAVKFSLTHTIAHEPSKFIEVVSAAWPKVLSNLKSLLETGSVVLEHQSPAGNAHSERK